LLAILRSIATHISRSLNSSKITSSILEPVSVNAVAMMLKDPPFSTLRAAPKKRFGFAKR
jgi:hypothetical protein